MKPNEFITSDTHFGHKAMIRYANRPFKYVDEMDTAMIGAWNAKVPPGSIVYHLGDFSFHKAATTASIVRALNGTIRLVRGNHDKKSVVRGEAAECFEWIRDRYESKCESTRKIVMTHEPLLTWAGAHKGALHCHGHSHGNLPASSQPRIDVGVDTTRDYAPLSFDELMDRFDGKTYCPVDHHVPKNMDVGTWWSVCGKPQYQSPGGVTCPNGHGGAPPRVV